MTKQLFLLSSVKTSGRFFQFFVPFLEKLHFKVSNSTHLESIFESFRTYSFPLFRKIFDPILQLDGKKTVYVLQTVFTSSGELFAFIECT